MKKVFIALFFILPVFSIAQEVIKSPYGETATVYRLPAKQLGKLNSSNKKLHDAVFVFENWLDTEKKGVLAGGYITASNNDYAFYKTVITDAEPKFDLKPYETEVNLYTQYVVKRKSVKKAEADSLEIANYNDFQNKEIAKKKSSDSINLVWKIADSISRAISKINEDERQRINDSTSKADFAKEQKIRKTDCIKKYGAKYGPIIANDDVVIGMNKTMVEDAWGPAPTTNETLVKGIHVVTWEYSYKKWAIFKNGIVVSVNK